MSGVASFVGVAATFAGLSSAQAQTAATLNLQSQLNILLPSIAAPSPSFPEAPTATATKLTAEAAQQKCTDYRPVVRAVREATSTDEKLKAFAAQISEPELKEFKDIILRRAADETYFSNHPKSAAKAVRVLSKKTRAKFVYPPSAPCQPPSLKMGIVLNPTYETDVLKTGNNSSPGASFGVGGTAQYTTPGVGKLDVIALSASTASSRYSDFPTKNLDAVSGQAFYQFFIDGQDDKGRPIDPSSPANFPKSPNLLTFDYLALGFQNQTAFTPTFHSETSNLFTPQATLGRSNMNLNPGSPSCSNGQSGKNEKDSFCNYLDLALTAGQTFSDVTSLENFNLAASATVSRKIDKTEWTIALQGIATGRTYEDFAGGRDDVLLQAGPVLSFSHSFPGEPVALSFSVSASYYQNYSTLAKAAWGGVIIQPTLTLAFLPLPPAK
jgi:hypothetical protein